LRCRELINRRKETTCASSEGRCQLEVEAQPGWARVPPTAIARVSGSTDVLSRSFQENVVPCSCGYWIYHVTNKRKRIAGRATPCSSNIDAVEVGRLFSSGLISTYHTSRNPNYSEARTRRCQGDAPCLLMVRSQPLAGCRLTARARFVEVIESEWAKFRSTTPWQRGLYGKEVHG